MNTMTKTTIWQRATDIQLSKKAAKAQRRGRLLKTYSANDLSWYLQHGWAIASHTPSSYGQGQYWLLSPAA